MARQPPFRPASDAELELLKRLWELGPCSPAEVREALAARGTERAYTTVQTLLQRLASKGYAVRRRRAGATVYEAQLSQDEVLRAHLDDLARRVCDGRTSPLVHSLVRGKALSSGELERLRELIDEARDDPAARRERGEGP